MVEIYVLMYENGTMRPTNNVLREGGGKIQEKDVL
jgi:hypothetical protein